jgi:3D (Asp-Asp-Asp) domain-containing protein
MRTFPDINYFIAITVALLVMWIMVSFAGVARAEEWKVTAYCGCEKCCGKWSDGYFASGKKVYVGGVAINWLPFGTKVLIDGKEYTVEDRGAKSIFGSKHNHKKAVDIYFESHQEALNFGVKRLKVEIL